MISSSVSVVSFNTFASIIDHNEHLKSFLRRDYNRTCRAKGNWNLGNCKHFEVGERIIALNDGKNVLSVDRKFQNFGNQNDWFNQTAQRHLRLCNNLKTHSSCLRDFDCQIMISTQLAPLSSRFMWKFSLMFWAR